MWAYESVSKSRKVLSTHALPISVKGETPWELCTLTRVPLSHAIDIRSRAAPQQTEICGGDARAVPYQGRATSRAFSYVLPLSPIPTGLAGKGRAPELTGAAPDPADRWVALGRTILTAESYGGSLGTPAKATPRGRELEQLAATLQLIYTIAADIPPDITTAAAITSAATARHLPRDPVELGGCGGGRSRKLAKQHEQHALHGNGTPVEVRSGLRLCRSLMPQEGERRIDITRTARSPFGNVYTMYMLTKPRAKPELLRWPCCDAYRRLARAMLRGEATFCHSGTRACSAADGFCTVHSLARGWRLSDGREVDLPVDPRAAERFFSGFCAAFRSVCELVDGGGAGALVCGRSCQCHAGTRHPPRCHGSEIMQLRLEAVARDEMEERAPADVSDGLDGDLGTASADLLDGEAAGPSEAPPAPPDPPPMPCPADVQPVEPGGGGGGRDRGLAGQREKHTSQGGGGPIEVRSGLRLCRSLMPQEGEECIDITREAGSPLNNPYSMHLGGVRTELLRKPVFLAFGRLARGILRGEATFCGSEGWSCAHPCLCSVHQHACGWRLPDGRIVDLLVYPIAAARMVRAFAARMLDICRITDADGSVALVCGSSCRCDLRARQPLCHGSTIEQLWMESKARDEEEERGLALAWAEMEEEDEGSALAHCYPPAPPSPAVPLPVPPTPPTCPRPAEFDGHAAGAAAHEARRFLLEATVEARSSVTLQHEVYALFYAAACAVVGFTCRRTVWRSQCATLVGDVIAGTGFDRPLVSRMRILSHATAQALARDVLPGYGPPMRAADADGLEAVPFPANLHPVEIRRWAEAIGATVGNAKYEASHQRTRALKQSAAEATRLEAICINIDGLSVARRLAGSGQQQPTLGTGSDARSRLEARAALLMDMFEKAPNISMAAVTQTKESSLMAKVASGHITSRGLRSSLSHAREPGVDGVRLIWDERWREISRKVPCPAGTDASAASGSAAGDVELRSDQMLAAELDRIVSLAEGAAAHEVLPGRILHTRICSQCDGVALDVLTVYMPASSRPDHVVAAAWLVLMAAVRRIGADSVTVAGDFNAEVGGSTPRTANTWLQRLMAESGLLWITGDEPTYLGANGSRTCIDGWLAGPRLVNRLIGLRRRQVYASANCHLGVSVAVCTDGGRQQEPLRPRPPDYELLKLRQAGVCGGDSNDDDAGTTGCEYFTAHIADRVKERLALVRSRNEAAAGRVPDSYLRGISPREVVNCVYDSSMGLVTEIAGRRKAGQSRSALHVSRLRAQCDTVADLLARLRTARELAEDADSHSLSCRRLKRWFWNSTLPAEHRLRPLQHNGPEIENLWKGSICPGTPAEQVSDAKVRMAAEIQLVVGSLDALRDELSWMQRLYNARDSVAQRVRDEVQRCPLNPIGAIMRVMAACQPDAAPKHSPRSTGGLFSIFAGDVAGARELFGGEMLGELARLAARANAVKEACLPAVQRLLVLTGLTHEPVRLEGDALEAWLASTFTVERFDRLVARVPGRLATGATGQSSHPLRWLPPSMKELLVDAYREMARRLAGGADAGEVVPSDWLTWLCTLIPKKNRDCRLFKNLRDIWLLEHALKLMDGFLLDGLNDVAAERVPANQFGFRRRVGTPQPATAAHTQAEVGRRLAGAKCRSLVYRGFTDYSGLFESIARTVQEEVEARSGVATPLSVCLLAIRNAAHGMVETPYGFTKPPFKRGKGNPQGSKTGPVQSNLVLGVVQRAVELIVSGACFIGPEGSEVSVPALNFADDSSAMGDCGHTLQMYFSTVYVTALALELDVNVPAADGLTWTEVGCEVALRGFAEVDDGKLRSALLGGTRKFTAGEWRKLTSLPPDPRGRATCTAADGSTRVFAVVTAVADKSAWQGGLYENGLWVDDTSTVITLPLGPEGGDVIIPRIPSCDKREAALRHRTSRAAKGRNYRLLGQDIEVTGDMQPMRARLLDRCTEHIDSVGRMGGTGLSGLRSTSAAVVDGIIGTFGRSLPLRETAVAVEKRRVRTLARCGHRSWVDAAALVYIPLAAGGGAMGCIHAADIACASFVAQQLSHLGCDDGSPASIATQTAIAIAGECLGFRPCREEPSPLDFMPYWAAEQGALSEDSIGEAFYYYLFLAGCRVQRSLESVRPGALSLEAYPAHGLPSLCSLPPALYEPEVRHGLGLPFCKRLCMLGVRDLLDVYGGRGPAAPGGCHAGRWLSVPGFALLFLRADDGKRRRKDDCNLFVHLVGLLSDGGTACGRAAKEWRAERANGRDHRVLMELVDLAAGYSIDDAHLLCNGPEAVRCCRRSVRVVPGSSPRPRTESCDEFWLQPAEGSGAWVSEAALLHKRDGWRRRAMEDRIAHVRGSLRMEGDVAVAMRKVHGGDADAIITAAAVRPPDEASVAAKLAIVDCLFSSAMSPPADCAASIRGRRAVLLPGSSAANWQYLVTPEQTLFRGSDGPRVHGLAPGAADVARLGRAECERAAAEIESASIKTVLSECVDWQSTTALWAFERGDAYAAEKLPARAGLTAGELRLRTTVLTDPILRLWVRSRALEIRSPRQQRNASDGVGVDCTDPRASLAIDYGSGGADGGLLARAQSAVVAQMPKGERASMSMVASKALLEPILRLHSVREYTFGAFTDGSGGGACGFGCWMGVDLSGPLAFGGRLPDACNNQHGEFAGLVRFAHCCISKLNSVRTARSRLAAAAAGMPLVPVLSPDALEAVLTIVNGGDAPTADTTAAATAVLDEQPQTAAASLLSKLDDMSRRQRAIAFTDSETVADLAERAWRAGSASELPKSCAAALEELCLLRAEMAALGCPLDVMWVRAHGGIYGNHCADAVAKAAAQMSKQHEPALRCSRSLARLMAMPDWATHKQPPNDAFASMESFSALLADGKTPFRLLRQRLTAARTWRALGGKSGTEAAPLNSIPCVDYTVLGWPAPPRTAGVWTGLAKALGRLNEDYGPDRCGELRLSTAGVRSTLSCDRWVLKCSECPLCGRRDVLVGEGADCGVDRQHFLDGECLAADGSCIGDLGGTRRRAISAAVATAVGSVPGILDAPDPARHGKLEARPTDEQLHSELLSVGTTLGERLLTLSARTGERRLQFRAAVRVLCGVAASPGAVASWEMRHGDGVWSKPEDAVVLSKGEAARKRASVTAKVAKALDYIADVVAGHFEDIDKLLRRRLGHTTVDDEAGNAVVIVNAAGSDADDSDDGERFAQPRREREPGLDEPAARDPRWLDAPAIASSAGRLGAAQRLLRQRRSEGEALSQRHHRSDCSLMGRVVLARMRSRSRSVDAVSATRRAAQRSVGVHAALTAMRDDAGAALALAGVFLNSTHSAGPADADSDWEADDDSLPGEYADSAHGGASGWPDGDDAIEAGCADTVLGDFEAADLEADSLLFGEADEAAERELLAQQETGPAGASAGSDETAAHEPPARQDARPTGANARLTLLAPAGEPASEAAGWGLRVIAGREASRAAAAVVQMLSLQYGSARRRAWATCGLPHSPISALYNSMAVLLYARCDGAWCGAIRCLLSSNTIFIEEAIVADFMRRRYVLTHLLLAAMRTFAAHVQWIRLQVHDDAVHAMAAYTGLGMAEPTAEQCDAAGWHPRVDGPATGRHRILCAPVEQMRAAAAARSAGTPPPEMAVAILGRADADVTARDVRSARATAVSARRAMDAAVEEGTRLWNLARDRQRSGGSVAPARVRGTQAAFDRARRMALAHGDAIQALFAVERMAEAAGGEAAAALVDEGVAAAADGGGSASDGGDGDPAAAMQSDEAMAGGGASGGNNEAAGSAGDGAAMAVQNDEEAVGSGVSGGGADSESSDGGGAAAAMQADEAMASDGARGGGEGSASGGDSGPATAMQIDEAMASGGVRGDGEGSASGGDSGVATAMQIDEQDMAGAGGGSVGGGAGGPMRPARRRAARPSRSTRRAMQAAHARDGEPGGGR